MEPTASAASAASPALTDSVSVGDGVQSPDPR